MAGRIRRAYGEGSISLRRDGRYQVALSLGGGRRVYAYGNTQEEAERLLLQLQAEHPKQVVAARWRNQQRAKNRLRWQEQ